MNDTVITGVLRIIVLLSVILSISTSGIAGPITLPKDDHGWTLFTPSTDTRIVYVSSDGSDTEGEYYGPSDPAIGNDPFNPTGPIKAFASYNEAYAHTRDGYPDWVLLKRGDTFNFSIGANVRSGRASDEPFLIGSYGAPNLCPVVQTGAEQALGTHILQYFALSGIDFYAHTRDPDGADYVSGDGASGFRLVSHAGDAITGLLMEGCKFRFYRNNQIQKYQGTAIGDIVIRRCLFTDNYSESSHAQGLYSSTVDGLTLEENIFIHNGWYRQQDGGGNEQSGGQATMFNHNTYFTNATNVTFTGNIFLLASSIGTKWTSNDGFQAENIILENNLFVDGEIAISLGGNTEEPLRFINPVVRNNVITDLGRSRPTNRSLGWGIDAQDWDGGTIAGNLLIHQPLSSITNTYGINILGTLRNVSITGNILHGIRFADGINLSEDRGSDVSGMVFSDNKIQIAQDAKYFVDAGYDTTGKWTFSNNTYYSDRETTRQFRIAGSEMSPNDWQAATGDTAVMEASEFPDTSRNIASYQDSIGQTATIEAFVAACRAQDRYNWDPRYTASAANTWIRAGFGLEPADNGGGGNSNEGDDNNGGGDSDGGNSNGGDGGGGSGDGSSSGGCFIALESPWLD